MTEGIGAENIGEVVESAEVERSEPSTVIAIEMMRHGTKEKDPSKSDEQIRLTAYGKFQALDKALQQDPMIEALGRGSMRERTLETAGTTAKSEKIVGAISRNTGIESDKIPELVNEIVVKKGTDLSSDAQLVFDQAEQMSLESLEKLLNADVVEENGELKWLEQDARLNFAVDNGTAFGEKFNQHYLEGKDALRYLAAEGDRDAVESLDSVTTGYSKMSGDIAELLLGYVETIRELDRLMKTNPEKYTKIKRDGVYKFERVFGTHATVGDSFATKAVELVAGVEERDKMIANIPNGAAETEGPRFEISSKGDAEPEIRMTLPKRWLSEGMNDTVTLTSSVLERMVADRDELKQKISDKLAETSATK